MDSVIEDQNEYRLGILREMMQFCEENGIKCLLAWGSLLGAVREGGIIPWDYDIDVMMTREDYDRFVEGFGSKNGRYQLWAPETNKKYKGKLGIVVDTYTECVNLKLPECNPLEHLFVEIYVFDALPSGEEDREALLNKMCRLSTINRIKTSYWTPGSSFVKNIVMLVLRTLLSPFPEREIIKKTLEAVEPGSIIEYASTYNGRPYCEKHVSAEFFQSTELVDFDGVMCRIPNDYHKFLTDTYGDYMTPPPLEDRERAELLKDSCVYRYVQR